VKYQIDELVFNAAQMNFSSICGDF